MGPAKRDSVSPVNQQYLSPGAVSLSLTDLTGASGYQDASSSRQRADEIQGKVRQLGKLSVYKEALLL